MSTAGSFDVIVVGGGAAGLFAAGVCGQRGRRTLVLEHREQVGKKLLISGGGRCNFTNREVSAKNYVSANPHFCRSALAGYGSGDFISLVKSHGIDFHERTHGQLFCDQSARQIVTMLLGECPAEHVTIGTGRSISEIAHADGLFRVRTSLGEVRAPSLIVASGGLSMPKLGATDLGLRVAKQFGLAIERPAPALTPLVLGSPDRERLLELQGLTAPAVVSLGSARFAEAVLFTHHGLSGPAILQISSYWTPGDELLIDWSPERELFSWLKERKARGDKLALHNALAEVLPRKLALHLIGRDASAAPLREQSDAKLRSLSGAIHRFAVKPAHGAGYDKAEVMRGGVSTDELSQKTMEAKKVPGLFFVGEVVDVTGWLGGYNFQWAWSSGFAAGQAA